MKSTRKGLGKGRGTGYKNLIKTDPVVHQRAGKGQKTYSSPTQRKMSLVNYPPYIVGVNTSPFINTKTDVPFRYDVVQNGKILGSFDTEKEAQKSLKDSDGDGVPDKFDCKPFDPTKQDSKLTKDNYLQIGKEAGLDSLNQEQFTEFMLKRFPKEESRAYATEWAMRFKSGHPISSMDSISEKVYDEIVKKSVERDESYQGWKNWDTWNTMLILDNDERTSKWLDEWAKNFKKKKTKGKFDYEKAEKVVKKYLVPVARGNKSWVTSRQLYAGQGAFTGDKSIDPKKVNAREVVDAILEREV